MSFITKPERVTDLSWDEAEAELQRLHDVIDAVSGDEYAVGVAADAYCDHRAGMIEREPASIAQAIRQIELATFNSEAVVSGVDMLKLIRRAKAIAAYRLTAEQETHLSHRTDRMKALAISAREQCWLVIDEADGRACDAGWTGYTLLGILLEEVSAADAILDLSA